MMRHCHFVVICSCGNFWILYDLDGNHCVGMLIFWGIFELLSCLVLSSLDNVGH